MIWTDAELIFRDVKDEKDALGNPIETAEEAIPCKVRRAPFSYERAKLEGRDVFDKSTGFLVPASFRGAAKAKRIKMNGKIYEIEKAAVLSPRWTLIRIRGWRNEN